MDTRKTQLEAPKLLSGKAM